VPSAGSLAATLNDVDCTVGCTFSNSTMFCGKLDGTPNAFVTPACLPMFRELAECCLTDVAITSPPAGWPYSKLSPDTLALVAPTFPRISSLYVLGDFPWSTVIAAARACGPALQTLTIQEVAADDPLAECTFDDRLQGLTTRVLRRCGIIRFTRAHLASLTRLQVLDLSRNGLSELQQDLLVDVAAGLEELYVRFNEVTAVPTGVFAGLSRLRFLGHNGNRIATIPPGSFDDLRQLLGLNLKNNRFASLSDGLFDHLVSLTALAISENQLTVLSTSLLATLGSLRELSLTGNNISTLNADIFRSNTNLVLLVLAGNSISQLPPGIFDYMPDLAYLDISGNLLTALDEGIFARLPLLVALLLGSNNLATLPTGVFQHQRRLQTLHIDQNGLVGDLSEVFSPLMDVRALNVSFNSGLTSVGHAWRRNAVGELDVSGTLILLEVAMCQPDTIVSFRNMKNASARVLAGMIVGCTSVARFIDLSNNTVLSNLTFLRSALNNVKIALPVRCVAEVTIPQPHLMVRQASPSHTPSPLQPPKTKTIIHCARITYPFRYHCIMSITLSIALSGALSPTLHSLYRAQRQLTNRPIASQR